MDLRSFLADLEREDELIRITRELSTEFEASGKLNDLQGGPAVIFENVKGFDMKVVGNVCGTRERIARALGVKRDKLISRLIGALKNPSKPKETSDAPVYETINEKVNLGNFPILRHFEKDGGRYVTSSIVVAKNADSNRNLSFHRMQVIGKNRLAIRIVQRDLHKIFSSAEEQNEDLEIAAILGVHPAISVSAGMSPPYEFDEYTVAGALLEDLRLAKCHSVDLEIPARSEIVLEGKLLCEERTLEGPVVDITGTYDVVREQPIFEVDCTMMREDALYQAILPSSTEHQLLMGMPREPLIYERIGKDVEINNVVLTPGGCGWLHGVVSISRRRENDGKKAIEASFKAHPSMKNVVVVDNDIDIYDLRQVEWAIATRSRGDRDIVIKKDVKGSSLDPTADPKTGLGSKMGIDATKDLEEHEKFRRAKIPRGSSS